MPAAAPASHKTKVHTSSFIPPLSCLTPNRSDCPIGLNLSTAVILSRAKDRRSAQPEILRCAQDDRLKLTLIATAHPNNQLGYLLLLTTNKSGRKSTTIGPFFWIRRQIP